MNDSRLASDGAQVRRRRECVACGERFTTFERVELAMPRVIKRDGSREPFDEDKLRTGMQRALQKRPVGAEALEASIGRICRRLQAGGDREIAGRRIGELVMQALRELDEVAYVRFASVYRSFQDVNAFREEIEQMQRQGQRPEASQMSLLEGEQGDSSKGRAGRGRGEPHGDA